MNRKVTQIFSFCLVSLFIKPMNSCVHLSLKMSKSIEFSMGLVGCSLRRHSLQKGKLFRLLFTCLFQAEKLCFIFLACKKIAIFRLNVCYPALCHCGSFTPFGTSVNPTLWD